MIPRTRRDFITAAAIAAVQGKASGLRLAKGVCRGLFPRDMPLEQCCREAKRTGFEALELPMAGELDPDASRSQVETVGKTVHNAGLAVAAVWASLREDALASPDPQARVRGREIILKAIEFAPLLDCGVVLVVPGQVGRGPQMRAGYQVTWERCTAGLKQVLPAAERAKVVLAIENLPNRFLVSPFDMRNFVDQFRSQAVGVFLDIGNALAYGYPQDWIAILGPRIKGLHAKDRRASSGTGPAPALLEGDVDWKAVMASLEQTKYRGSISVESGHDPNDPEQLKKLSAALDRILVMV